MTEPIVGSRHRKLCFVQPGPVQNDNEFPVELLLAGGTPGHLRMGYWRYGLRGLIIPGPASAIVESESGRHGHAF